MFEQLMQQHGGPRGMDKVLGGMGWMTKAFSYVMIVKTAVNDIVLTFAFTVVIRMVIELLQLLLDLIT